MGEQATSIEALPSARIGRAGAVKVKAQALINAARWIEETRGAEALSGVLADCPESVRVRYMTAIAIEWHPIEALIDLLEVAERLLGPGDGSVARAMGAAGARSNMRGIVKRSLFYLASPEFLLRRIAALWSQFNDTGAMH